MEWLWNVALVAGIAGIAVWLLIRFQQHLSKPGGRNGTGAAAGFGSMESVFAPSSYEARLELERQGQKQAPAPAPGDPMHGLHVAVDDEGLPCRVVIKPLRPRP